LEWKSDIPAMHPDFLPLWPMEVLYYILLETPCEGSRDVNQSLHGAPPLEAIPHRLRSNRRDHRGHRRRLPRGVPAWEGPARGGALRCRERQSGGGGLQAARLRVGRVAPHASRRDARVHGEGCAGVGGDRHRADDTPRIGARARSRAPVEGSRRAEVRFSRPAEKRCEIFRARNPSDRELLSFPCFSATIEVDFRGEVFSGVVGERFFYNSPHF
jgi:hypothetical protein